MAIESVGSGSAMTYQSSSDVAVKPIQQAKDAHVEQAAVATTMQMTQ